MALAHVGVTTTTDNGTVSTRDVVRSVTSGNLCLISIRWYGTATVSSVTCSGETVTLVGSAASGAPNAAKSQWAWFTASSTASKTVTVTLSASANDIKLSFIEISGQASSPIGNSATATDVSTANPSTSLTATANSAIYAVLMTGSLSTTPGTDYTDLGIQGWWSEEEAEYDIDVGAAGSKTVNWTSNAATWHIDAIEIKVASGAGAALAGSASTSGHQAPAPVFLIGL